MINKIPSGILFFMEENMNKIILKKGLFWVLTEEGIIFYYTNSKLKRIIKSEDDKKLFNFLKFISSEKSYDEIKHYAYINEISDPDKLINYLLKEKYIEFLESGVHINNKEKRLANFIGTFPHTSYIDYKKKSENMNFCFLGLGTAGSYSLDALLKMGFYNATLIDNDIVEEHNVISQNFSYQDVGVPKVKVLSDRYNNLSSSYNIIPKNEFIHSFNQLHESVDLTTFDYLLLFADDYLLTLDIIENIFKINPNIKLIQSGYAVLEVESIVITIENYKVILSKLKKDYQKFDSLQDIIVENSGTILESYMIALTTVKQIVDQIIELNNTEFMKTDFLTNDYYIGSQFEYLYKKSNRDDVKNLLYNFSSTDSNIEDKWIKDITNNNIFNVNVNNSVPVLDSQKQKYIIETDDSNQYVPYLLENKNVLKSHESSLSNRNIVSVKEHIFEKILLYVNKNFDCDIYNLLKSTIDNDYIYTFKNKYTDNSSLTIKNSNNIFIFNYLDGSTSKYNMLIHEIFHSVYYFMGNDDTYDHENFVFKHHMELLYELKSDDIFKDLFNNFIYNHIHIYICNSLSLDYEKYSLLKDLKPFFIKWGSDDIDEMVNIISTNINPKYPLHNYKYIYAINNNIDRFIFIIKELLNSTLPILK